MKQVQFLMETFVRSMNEYFNEGNIIDIDNDAFADKLEARGFVTFDIVWPEEEPLITFSPAVHSGEEYQEEDEEENGEEEKFITFDLSPHDND